MMLVDSVGKVYMYIYPVPPPLPGESVLPGLQGEGGYRGVGGSRWDGLGSGKAFGKESYVE